LRVAIGVAVYDNKSQPNLEEYRHYLAEHGCPMVAMPVDAENPMDMARLLGYLSNNEKGPLGFESRIGLRGPRGVY
jgi:hypothetical protein